MCRVRERLRDWPCLASENGSNSEHRKEADLAQSGIGIGTMAALIIQRRALMGPYRPITYNVRLKG